MSNGQSEIKNIFEELLKSNGEIGQRVRKRIDHGSPVKLYAARLFPGNNLMLEIGPIKKAYLASNFIRPFINGLEITFLPEKKGVTGDITLLLELKQTDANDVFVTFAARICEEMDRHQSPAEAVRNVFILLERWKSFFAGNSEILSVGQQIGIYGELYLMARLYDERFPIRKLVQAWTGSRRTNQDYEFNNAAVEVKSTASVSANTVNISNVRQLDDTGIQVLLLAHVILDTRRGTERSLPALVNYIRSIINEHANEVLLDFEEKILLANYRDQDAEYYAERSYTERDLKFYQVKEGFPRLLERNLPTGINKASYEIALEHCKPFSRPTEGIFEIMRKYCD